MSNVEINPNKEYILAADISSSMSTTDQKCGGQRRYDYMLEKFKLFIKTAEDFDQHGAPCVMLFGENVQKYDHIKLENIEAKLSKVTYEGFTNLHKLLDEAFDEHLEKKRELAREKKFHPGTVLMVFTDGEPTNRQAVIRSIINISDSIDTEDEFQIMILTVGTVSRELADYLKGLHDDLEDKTKRDFDIIHVDQLEDVNFMGAVSGKLAHAS